MSNARPWMLALAEVADVARSFLKKECTEADLARALVEYDSITKQLLIDNKMVIVPEPVPEPEPEPEKVACGGLSDIKYV